MLRLVASLFVVILLCTSCSLGGIEMKKLSDEKIIADRSEQIIEAIQNKDREKMKSMFSKQALSETEDIDGGIDYLFSLVQGDIVSWESEAPSSDGSIDHGKVVKMIRGGFDVITTEGVYLFFLLEYSEDDKNPDNVGLYTLWAIKEGEGQFASWQAMKIPGIYIPEE